MSIHFIAEMSFPVKNKDLIAFVANFLLALMLYHIIIVVIIIFRGRS